jgi:rsbT co-antagonist protein RsbR
MDEQPLDIAALRADMNLDRHEIDRRKAWLRFGDDDVKLLSDVDGVVNPHLTGVIDALAEELMADGDGSAGRQERGRSLLRDYFGGLTSSGWCDDAFVEQRLALLGAFRREITPEVSWYLAAYLFYLEEVAALVRERPGSREEMRKLHGAVAKVVFLDLGLAIDAYMFERDRTIRSQQRELEQLSTPVLQLRQGLLILPIVGMLDSRRAQQLTEQLLLAIRTRRGRVVVLDVTGVAAVDSRVANHLIQTVDAARLMGATAIITGVSPEVAQTLVGLGIDLGSVTTLAELQDGVDEADRVLGLRVVAVDDLPVDGRQA